MNLTLTTRSAPLETFNAQFSSSSPDLLEEASSTLTLKITDLILNTFRAIDRFLTLPIPGVKADVTASIHSVSSQHESVDSCKIDPLSCAKDRLYEWWNTPSPPPLESLIRTCQKDPAACFEDSSSRRSALDDLTDRLTKIFVSGAQINKIQDCHSSYYCPLPDNEYTIHPREKKAAEVFHSRESLANRIKSFFIPPEWANVLEFLRFRADDEREKLLVTVAESDHNGFLNPRNIAHILSQFSQKYDVRYQVVKTPQDIRNAVSSAVKSGLLSHVLINGHGNPYGIHLSDGEYLSIYTPDLDSMFSGLLPNGKILLISCSVGAPKDMNDNPVSPNFAQTLAEATKRTVIASTDVVIAGPSGGFTDLLSEDTSMLYHPDGILYSFIPFYNTNIYKPFKATFKECSPLLTNTIQQNEIKANTLIKENLNSKTLLSDAEKKQGASYLGFCKDDPREKFLFFVAEFEKNAFLDPTYAVNVLGPLAEAYDLKYKRISSFNDICDQIDEASKYGTIGGIIIASHGTPSEGVMLSDDQSMTINNRFKTCISKLKPKAPIVFLGGSIGQNSTNSLAQKISQETRRDVIAPTCPISISYVTIQSIDPLMMSHSKWSVFRNYFLQCPENNENLIKTSTLNT